MFRSFTQKIAPLLQWNLQNVISVLPTSKNFHFLTLANLKVQSICPAANQFINDPAKVGFLSPVTPLVEQVAGFKVKGRLRRRCKDCYFVMRQERLYVICKTHPRHKQMAMKKRDYKSWILTHATQSKVRPY